MPALKHIHTYIRWKKRGNPPSMWWRCADPKCTHIIQQDIIVGKESLCNTCGLPFILDWKSFTRAKPECLNCQDTVEGREYRANKELTQALMGGLIKADEEEKMEELTGITGEDIL